MIEAPAESHSYLDDLLKDFPEINSKNYSETLGNKLEWVLDNQRTLFFQTKSVFLFHVSVTA